MSYILDALKRADAERERGAVPGLHTRPVETLASQTTGIARNPAWWVVGVLLVLCAMAATGLWIWQKPGDAVRLAATEPAVATVPKSDPSAHNVSPPVATPASPLPRQSAAVASRPVQSSRPPAEKPATAGVKPSPPKPTPPPILKPKPDPVAKVVPAQAVPPPVQLLGHLPEDFRRQIPALTITGSVYSNNPGKRLLLVNNQVLAPGSVAAPGVKLEEIQAKSSVFIFRGTRFRMLH